jgi:NADH-quinone oxidoreductase subunit M
MGGLLESNLLSVAVFLPIVTVLVLIAIEGLGKLFGDVWKLSENVWKVIALLSSVVGFLVTLEIWNRFDSTSGTMQMVERVPWIGDYGITYYLGVDGLSLFLVILTGFLLPVILLACWTDVVTRVKQFIFFMLALQTGMLGAFLALNMFLFYVFWEIMLIPMYFVIGVWGGPRRIYATIKFFIYTMVGSLLMLIGILVLVYLHHQQFGVLTFDYIGFGGASGIIDTIIRTESGPWWQSQFWLFMAFALAFAIKVPMFPFHTWLPDAHVEAPTPGSAVLAGVLLKLGTYGFVRYAMPLFAAAADQMAPMMIGLALIGIVYGALVAMVQSDVKKLVAYSSVSHLGFVMLGLFAFNLQGVEGAMLQMVNHGISTGALFILVGMIYERRHTREISEFGGIAHIMPIFAAFFMIATLSSIGLPMLNGFVGEFLILLGAFGANPWVAVIAATGVILSAVYMLWMVRRVFFGPVVHEVNKKLLDLNLREKVVCVALTIPMFWIGMYPSPFLRPMDASINTLLETMQARGAEVGLEFAPAAEAETAALPDEVAPATGHDTAEPAEAAGEGGAH